LKLCTPVLQSFPAADDYVPTTKKATSEESPGRAARRQGIQKISELNTLTQPSDEFDEEGGIYNTPTTSATNTSTVKRRTKTHKDTDNFLVTVGEVP
jgi:hypothetical protein